MTDEFKPAVLQKLLRYDPETGEMFWRERMPDMFSDGGSYSAKRKCSAWNARYANQPALCANHSQGRLGGSIFDQAFLAHRVAWAMYYGAWPKNEIDHKNGIRSDNRISNLRDVSTAINARNRFRSGLNTSGFNGVSWNKKARKWEAYVKIDGKRKYLGYFSEIESAIAARKNAEVGFGFTERHGAALSALEGEHYEKIY